MQLYIDYDRIDGLFRQADADGRNALFEDETYELLRLSGSESVPAVRLLTRHDRLSNDELQGWPGKRAVFKIAHPWIIHKSDVGGVRIVDKQPGRMRSTWRRMLDEVPEAFAQALEKGDHPQPAECCGLHGSALRKAIREKTRGVLLCEYMPPDSQAFGNELLVSLRRTREFGTVITAGLGGTDTELYAQRFRKGQAVVCASVETVDESSFFELFRKTIAYEKLAGFTRGQSRLVSDDQLRECFASFIDMGRTYSPLNAKAPAVIEELEINPFSFSDYQMVPLDGMCRFSQPQKLPSPRPVQRIGNLLRPETIGIVGVSSSRRNFGRIILDNVLEAGFAPDCVSIVRSGGGSIDGVRCVEDLKAMGKVDLFIVAVGAAQVPDLVDSLIDGGHARSVMLIPGGMGETEQSRKRARQVIERIDQTHAQGAGPVFLGGNCLGVRSRPGRYDTIFIPGEKLPKGSGKGPVRSAFISQSGAFLVTRTSKLPGLDPDYMISIGNQTDLTAGDMLQWFAHNDDMDVIAVYMEGFRDFDGLAFCRAVRRAVLAGREVLFYKAGRTPEGQSATSGHTASVAGDYMVCESLVRQAGATVADTFTQFEDLCRMACAFHHKQVTGNRLAAASGAGFEAVGMADSIQGDDFHMSMADFSQQTANDLKGLLEPHGLMELVNIQNPLDINPAADDTLHVDVVRTLMRDPGVDGVVAGLDPLSPAMHTLSRQMDDVHSIARLFPELVRNCQKPLVGVVDAGRLYTPLYEHLEDAGVPVFRSCDRAVAALAKYVEGRLYADALRREAAAQED